jgi:hypothetical protein
MYQNEMWHMPASTALGSQRWVDGRRFGICMLTFSCTAVNFVPYSFMPAPECTFLFSS